MGFYGKNGKINDFFFAEIKVFFTSSYSYLAIQCNTDANHSFYREFHCF